MPGAAYFDSVARFAMIRGGHVDIAVLVTLEVRGRADVANWAVPGKDVLGVDGAMDIVVGVRRVLVTMTASPPRSEPKVVHECAHPLTAAGAADVIVAELSLFRLLDGQLYPTELLDNATLRNVAAVATVPFAASLDVRDSARFPEERSAV